MPKLTTKPKRPLGKNATPSTESVASQSRGQCEGSTPVSDYVDPCDTILRGTVFVTLHRSARPYTKDHFLEALGPYGLSQFDFKACFPCDRGFKFELLFSALALAEDIATLQILTVYR